MALDDIKKSILNDAQAQAEAIDSETRKRIDQINADWSKKIEARKLEIIAQAQRKTDQKIRQTEFRLQAQSQAQVLTKKQEVIDAIYKTAYKQLCNLNDNEYVDLMAKLITRLPGDTGQLISVDDKEALLKKGLKQSGKKFEVTNETSKGHGGFIFKSDHLEINQTFQSLITESKESTLTEVATILFDNNKEE